MPAITMVKSTRPARILSFESFLQRTMRFDEGESGDERERESPFGVRDEPRRLTARQVLHRRAMLDHCRRAE